MKSGGLTWFGELARQSWRRSSCAATAQFTCRRPSSWPRSLRLSSCFVNLLSDSSPAATSAATCLEQLCLALLFLAATPWQLCLLELLWQLWLPELPLAAVSGALNLAAISAAACLTDVDDSAWLCALNFLRSGCACRIFWAH